MRKLLYKVVLGVIVLLFVACKDEGSKLSPEEQALTDAVSQLRSRNYRGYMDMVVSDTVLDSTQLAWRQLAVQQFTETLVRRYGALTHISFYDIDSLSDSVRTIYYYQHFASGDSLACSQTLVRKKGIWKLKI